MADELHRLENALKEYLSEGQKDSYNSASANFYKYNNLKIFMEPRHNSTPHFIIRIGISEAMYNIETKDKMSGGLGSDERLIRRWLEKTNVKSELTSVWAKSMKIKTVTMKEDLDED